LIGLASPEIVNTLSPIRSFSILTSPLVVFIRVPGKKQLQRRTEGQGVAARELGPVKLNLNATPAPTRSFEAARKLRRDVESVALPLAQALREPFPSSGDPIAKPPNLDCHTGQ
jgi:hypothetical protein